MEVRGESAEIGVEYCTEGKYETKWPSDAFGVYQFSQRSANILHIKITPVKTKMKSNNLFALRDN